METLRRLGTMAHRAAFASRATAATYVAACSVIRRIPLPTSVVVRFANAANTAAAGRSSVFGAARPRAVVTPAGEIRLLLRPQDYGFRPLLSRSLGYEDEVYRVLFERLSKYDAVIEIGAHVGVFTVAIGRRFQAEGKDLARVVAFEPAEATFRRLRANLDLNGLQGVQAIQRAVSDRDGSAAFFESAPLGTTNSLHPRFASRAVPPTETVVRTIDAAHISSFAGDASRILVKVDAEGHEATILSRFGALVRERKPDFIVEVLRPMADSVANVVAEWGYRTFHISDVGAVAKPLTPANANHHSRDWLLTPSPEISLGSR